MIRTTFQRYGPALIGAGCGVVIVLALVVLGQIRATQVDHASAVENGSAAAKAAADGTKRIEDCTTPGRSCFDDAQKRLAGTISALIADNQRTNAASATCGAQLAPQLAHMTRNAAARAVYVCQQQLLHGSLAPRKH